MRKLGSVIVALVLCSASAQPEPAGTPPQEFPVQMRQSVVAGQTPVGSKVEAKLAMATLVSGKVIPAGAILSGEVLASEAKTAAKPSRLAIRVDSARWKNNSLSLKAYLTAWYYPLRIAPGDDSANDRRTGTEGENDVTRFPKPLSQRLPSGQGADFPYPALTLSLHRVRMKDVDSVPLADGGAAIISSRSNLKLDTTQTYVLATGDLPESK